MSAPTLTPPALEEGIAPEPVAYAFYGAALPEGLRNRVFEVPGRLVPSGALRPIASAHARRTDTGDGPGYPATVHDIETLRFRRVRDALPGGPLYVDVEGTVWSPVVRVSIEWRRLPEDAPRTPALGDDRDAH